MRVDVEEGKLRAFDRGLGHVQGAARLKLRQVERRPSRWLLRQRGGGRNQGKKSTAGHGS